MSHSKLFNIISKNYDDIKCLILNGELDAHTANELENSLKELITHNNLSIIVNFSGLDYISSAGLGVFMGFIEEVRDAGGDIKLTNMKPKVFSVFDLLGFPILFDILPTDEEAITKFKDNN